MSALSRAARLENTVRARGLQILGRMDASQGPNPFGRQAAHTRLLAHASQDAAFRTGLLRFVDVLPVLNSPADVVGHLRDYLADHAGELGLVVQAGLGAASLAPGLAAAAIKAEVTSLARQFVVGETVAELVARFRANAELGLGTSLDLLGETVLSEAEADEFLARNLGALDAIARAASELPAVAGALNLSLKVSALTPDLHPAAPERSLVALARRLRPLLRRAATLGAFVNFDMETYELKGLTLALFRAILEEEEFRASPAAGIAIQAYTRDSEDDLRQLIGWARGHRRSIGVRLVKGAYWDYETVMARQRGWPSPVFSRKSATDANYERLTELLLDHAGLVTPAFGTHNVRSCAHAIAQAEARGLDPQAYEFQALYGMADELKSALLALGYRVREYCPVGSLLPGMSYLVRRLLENTSNQGWVAMGTHDRSQERWLEAPRRQPVARRSSLGWRRRVHQPTPLSNFALPEPREHLRAAIGRVEASLGRRWPLSIGGQPIADRPWIASLNPARPAQIVGYWAEATVEDAEAAVASARAAAPAWAGRSARHRAALLERAAELLTERRSELTALEIYETAKPWAEADADVCEAIDYCRYYARQARRLGRPRRTLNTAGESNHELWSARGVAVVIAPWNFPLAIACGMTVAALVTGNCVVLKPAEQSSTLGAVLVQLLLVAGAPPGVVNLITGPGETVGAHLVAHPGVDVIAFTGSRAVGLRIWETAGRSLPGQANLKRVLCEMGGKNALIIDEDADLDQAIPAALASAFGYSGQKCSALSRLVVLPGVYDRFVRRFLAACASVPVGDPTDPATVVGPVIDEQARRKILGYIEQGKREATLAFQGRVPASEGYYVPPTVFTDVERDSALAREEIFGPLVAIIKARDLADAFSVVNSSEYALTAGIFSRSPSVLRRARRELLVGNLYLNRPITGAVVGRQPFGGFRLSGDGIQAGGRRYLEHFLWSRVVSENTLRRGFAPDRA